MAWEASRTSFPCWICGALLATTAGDKTRRWTTPSPLAAALTAMLGGGRGTVGVSRRRPSSPLSAAATACKKKKKQSAATPAPPSPPHHPTPVQNSGRDGRGGGVEEHASP